MDATSPWPTAWLGRGPGGTIEDISANEMISTIRNQIKNERLLQAALEPWGWGKRKCIGAAGDIFFKPKKHDELVKRKMCIYKEKKQT